MKTAFYVSATAVFATAAALPPAFAANFPGQQQYGSQAQVPLQKAEAIAEHAFSGKIISLELEKERGGSGLRYSFDIRHGDTVHEVGVDARTGQVLENSMEESEDSDTDSMESPDHEDADSLDDAEDEDAD